MNLQKEARYPKSMQPYPLSTFAPWISTRYISTRHLIDPYNRTFRIPGNKSCNPTACISRDTTLPSPIHIHTRSVRIRGGPCSGGVSSIFDRSIISVPTMRYISVIPVACHPSISAERTVKRGSRGANLIYLSQVPSGCPPPNLPR